MVIIMNHLEKIESCIYSVLVEELYNIVPEYREIQDSFDGEDNNIYLFMNEFSTILSENLESNNNYNFINNSFIYINLLGESNNLEIINILKVGILEILYSHNNSNRDLIKNRLTDKVKDYFIQFSNYYW